MADCSKPKAATEPVATKSLSWDEIADLYGERTGGRARIKPMEAILGWALSQPDITEDEDGYVVQIIKPNATLSNLEGRDGG